MWRFKQIMHKEPAGLEGRSIDVGNLKIQVRNVIAEGGFSCVYLARDLVHTSKQYALKHIVCNHEELLELVMKEINVMKLLRGHPNVVTLYAHAIMDLGRTKEALLVMEYCDKSLVTVLDNRGSGFFDEKQILSIFRDVCSAVFAMHTLSPPIAHRDLKAENLLLGPDGLWKLCDFGSTSTNHKRFEKAEDMGIEEDNIRKHTTPAYRAPEMWDLFRRELINEKVDIWALGCLLFRICYFKSAFDGDSKLQILNGNYRIPELPKYSSSITDLIRDMLQASPDDRPDITQVWFRFNELLPVGLQKSLPDKLPEMHSAGKHEGLARPTHKSPEMPHRSPPPPPSVGESARNPSQVSSMSKAGGSGGPLGAFWSTQHAEDSLVAEGKPVSKFDDSNPLPKNSSTAKVENTPTYAARRSSHVKSHKHEDGFPKDIEINFFQKDTDCGAERPKASKPESATSFHNDAFNSFVAEFDTNKLSVGAGNSKSGKEEVLETEVERLKKQLNQANMEKSEITSKFEKLSAICRSQRQELQELTQTLAARTPSPNKDALRNQLSPGIQLSATPRQREKIEGTIWELQQDKSNRKIQSPETISWQPFAGPPEPPSLDSSVKSVRTRNGHQHKQAKTQVNTGFDSWGFGTENFSAVPTGSTQISRPIGGENKSHRFGNAKATESKPASQPAGWAGF